LTVQEVKAVLNDAREAGKCLTCIIFTASLGDRLLPKWESVCGTYIGFTVRLL